MQDTSTYPKNRLSDAELGSSRTSASSSGREASVLSRIGLSKALFVLAAGGSFLFSVYLWFRVDREQGLFVGLWVPSILALGALLFSGKGGQQ